MILKVTPTNYWEIHIIKRDPSCHYFRAANICKSSFAAVLLATVNNEANDDSPVHYTGCFYVM